MGVVAAQLGQQENGLLISPELFCSLLYYK